MIKKFGMLIFLLALAGLAACGSANTDQAGNMPAFGQGTPGAPAETIDSKLALGMLYLEGGENAISAEQAQTLLPLWKALHVLSSSETISQVEIQGIYDQIKEALSAEQLAAIEALNLTGEEMTALMKKYGIEAGAMAGNGLGADLTDEERATRIANRQAQNPEGMGGPGMGMGMGGNPPEGFTPPEGFNPGGNASGTPAPGMRAGGGFNTMFLDAVIRLLEEKIIADS